LKHVGTPGLDIALMRRVRREVLQKTGGNQIPWTNSSLTDSFQFMPASKTKQPDIPQTAVPSRFQEANTAYRAVQQIGSCQAYQEFEQIYPKSIFAKLSSEWRKKNCGARKATEVAFALQRELKRVGCEPGAIDGEWGPSSRAALARFNDRTQLNLDALTPTTATVVKIKEFNRKICPVIKASPKARQKVPSQASRTVRNRPSAVGHSFTIWGGGSIPTDAYRSRKTQYGTLACRGGNNGTGRPRRCSWK
jgi:hypothetical protein